MYMRENAAKYLNEKKIERNLTWDEIAEGAGVGKTTLLNYAKGCVNPRLDTIQQLCHYFGTTPNSMLLGNSADQFLMDHVLQTISELVVLPFEKKIKFVNLLLEMLQLWEPNQTPDPAFDEAKINNLEE